MITRLGKLLLIASLLVACGPALAGLPAQATLPAPTTTPLPSWTIAFTPTRTATRTLRPTWTAIATHTSFWIGDLSELAASGTADTTYWDQIIAQDPGNADAYFQRATIIYEAAVAVGSIEYYRFTLEQALKDIDQAISLRSDLGEYYSLRQSIYYELAWLEEFSVHNEQLMSIALENAYKAVELGTTEQYPERIIILDLIFTNQCQKALDEVQKLIDEHPAGVSSLGGLLHIRSQAYACLGRLEEALQSVNDSMFNDLNMGYKYDLKMQYLLMLERYEEALVLLNERICDCELGGWRYYMRAQVYYRQGKTDLALADLTEGQFNTWERGGWLPYVLAQIALDDGRTEEAIQLFQYAEATLNPTYNPLRWKIQEQLALLGSHPSTIAPSTLYQSTAIP